MKLFTPLISLSTAALINVAHAEDPSQDNCPILGPVLTPHPRPYSSSSVMQATQLFPKLLQDTLAQSSYSAKTSFSLNIFSGFDNTSIFSHHFAAPDLNKTLTSGSLNENTTYRVGSVTKLTVAYTLLVHSGFKIFSEPITSFIPELAEADRGFKNTVDQVKWSDITIEALLSHMSGITRDCTALSPEAYRVKANLA
jgi:hypothetical protein